MRLAKNWHRRAAVKRGEPDLDEPFDLERPDYPVGILPFGNHDAWLSAPDEARSRVLSWAWIAFNRRTITGEQQLANPAFELILENAYPGVGDRATHRAVGQAMVDEQYHMLMHRQASDVTRSRRRLALPDALLPETRTNIAHRRMRAASSDRREQDLITLAFATVSEVSINAYLGLLAHDQDIQPMNTATVRTHLRDEYCHSEICREVAKTVYGSLGMAGRRFFLAALTAALDAFVSTDFTTWEKIFAVENFPGRGEIIGDIRQGGSTRRLLRDYSGIYSLVTEIDALDLVDFDWGKSEVSPQEMIVADASNL
ncbi:MAG: diiron oxygenase [Streptosporangiaceae bacterium]